MTAALHLYPGQSVAECPHCKGALTKETPILSGDEDDPIMADGRCVGVRFAFDLRPKCPHCHKRFELVIHLKITP